jgi:tetratricopeptide (TPR) repeat protein
MNSTTSPDETSRNDGPIDSPAWEAEAESWRQAGVGALEAGRHAEAILAFGRAVELCPHHAQTHALLATAYAAVAPAAPVECAYRTALRLDPGLAEAHVRLAELLLRDNRLPEALAAYQAGVEAVPESAALWLGLGQANEACNRVEEAARAFREAARLAPGEAVIAASYASILWRVGDLAEALLKAEELVRNRPEDVDSYYILGNVLLRMQRPQEALAAYRRVRALLPLLPKAHFSLASPLLMLGEFDAGWAAYEARLRMGEVPWKVAHVRERLWEGGPLDGVRLLVHAEQGSGDTLQFIRYLPLLRRHAGPNVRIVFLCEPEMARLAASVEGCDEVLAPIVLGPFEYDLHVPLLSLPHRFGTTLDSIPANVPYIRLPPGEFPAVESPPDTRLKIAIVWAGRPTHSDDCLRSCPLEYFAGLFDLPDTQFISLQVGPRAVEIAPYLARPNVSSMTGRLTDFADTLAVIEQVDLLIAVDTSVVHLAGACGKPVWTLLCYGAEWRWLLDREDSPWYPSMKLFRQPGPGDWDAVFGRVRAELEERLANLPPIGLP